MKKPTSIRGSQAIRPDESRDHGALQSAPRHQAPTRRRYAAAHPGQTVRLQPEADAKVAAIRERLGVSFNQGVNIAIAGLDEDAIEAILARGEELGFQKGVKAARVAEQPARVAERAAGFADAANLYRLTVPCHKCGGPMEFRRDDTSASIAIRVLTDRRLVHTTCPSRPRYTPL